MRKQLMRGGLAVTALAAAASITWAADAPRAHAEPECLNGSNDFNSDGGVDVAVGMPGAAGGNGAVEVRVSDGEQGYTVHRIDAPSGAAGGSFGAATAEVAYYEGTVDQSTCTQLVVGAPDADVDGVEDAGAIYLYKWAGAEDGFTLVKKFRQGANGVPGQPQTGARFGAALAAEYHEPDMIGEVVTPLFVGAPGATVGDAEGAGGFVRMKFIGGDDPSATEAQLVTQNTEGVPGGAEAGDSFGTALAVVDGGVLASAPNEDLAGAADAGAMVHWTSDAGAKDVFVSQNTAGVPGSLEAGDNFGTAVYSARETTATDTDGGHYVLVGVPREDIGNVRNAGSAARFVFHGSLELDATKGFNQGTDGVKGTLERGDRLGTSFGSYGLTHLLAGSPGEDVGSAANAGAVVSLGGQQSWSQARADVPGAAEAKDRFGATMGNALYGMGGSGEDGWLSAVLVGTPGENDAAGAVVAGLPGGPGNSEGWAQQSPEAGDGYGSAIGKTN